MMSVSDMLIDFIIIVVVALLSFSVGHLLASRRHGHQKAELTVRLQHSEDEVQRIRCQNEACQGELEAYRSRLHAAELSVNTAQTQLSGTRETLRRLDDELAMYTAERAELQETLNALRETHHHTERRMEAVLVENRSLSDVLKETKEALSDYVRRYDSLSQTYAALQSDHVEIRTTLEKKEDHFREQMQQLGDARQSLLKEFENLANRVFEEKGRTFADTSQLNIANMLKPFREQIEGFQKRINEVHDVSLQGNATLNAEIRKVLDIGLQMSKEANSLASALKGDSQQRGAWGEAQLRRTLEMSGLMEDAHYEVQSSFRDAEGRQKQTDYLIKLPDGKHIIIDSKVSLNAYDRAIGAETQADHQLAMNEHVRAVRRHIDDLASKDYTNLIGIRSPSFVLMFMPIEPAYIDVLKANRDLFEYGYRKGIVLVSHTTLIPILRTVSNLWMIERSNAEAREISERAGDIYNSVCLVAERLSKLGGTLNTASNHYNSAVTALAGQQGLYGRVDRFRQLSAKVSRSLPALETNHMDFEADRLSLIVEPIVEPVQDTEA
ncbi:DNA recombination protein RmuC [Bombella sp. TMW 2.2559]|uniref:DNA recombination protein RmuC homolog n=1 Tax=Bombella dulcis TaxID=2967339 RepID=A0ABT3WBB9_9PROT|nr:DNA recombination protein RmuC [Bombella dulcis]MCX5615948.1 DNA recombination protein RmuC [Bombella dulcis]